MEKTDRAIAREDNTDHLVFQCGLCGGIESLVRQVTEPKSGQAVLKLHLRCQKCGAEHQKQIYPNPPEAVIKGCGIEVKDTSFAAQMKRAVARLKTSEWTKFITDERSHQAFLHTIKVLADMGDGDIDDFTFAVLTKPNLKPEQVKELQERATAENIRFTFDEHWKGRGAFFISTIKAPVIPIQLEYQSIDWDNEDEEEEEKE